MKKPTSMSLIPLLVLLAACGGKREEGTSTTSTPTASAKTSATPSATATAKVEAPKPPAWLAGVPQRAVTAKPGDRVWNASPYPNQQNVSFGVAEVASVEGNTATMNSLMRVGQSLVKDTQYAPKRPFTPAAFIVPARTIEQVNPKPKDWVIAPIFGYRTGIAQIAKVEGKLATIKYVNQNKVSEETTEYVEPLAAGVAPFGFAAMKVGSKTTLAIVIAVEGDQVFAIDDAGNVLKAAKADVKPVKVEWKDRKPGEKVTVFDASGPVETKIEKAIETKWVYEVKINGADKKVPFHQVVDKL